MNKIYKTVYNRDTQTWVAVSENTRSNKKQTGSSVGTTTTSQSPSMRINLMTAALAALFSLAGTLAYAAPYEAGGGTAPAQMLSPSAPAQLPQVLMP